MSDKVYKRKARPKIYVQAFIFGYDETPEWFTNCKRVCIPQRLIYENGKTISFAPGYLVDGQKLKTFIKIPENFKERFYIEYKELEDRSNKLSAMLEKWRNNSLDFTPSCSYELLEKQLQVMLEYKKILEERAKIEKISLE